MNKITIIIILFVFLVFKPFSLLASESIKASPDKFWTHMDKTHEITIKGGIPPYRWQTRRGHVIALSEASFSYTAPHRYGKDWIIFEDKAGQEVRVNIDILKPLIISPTKINMPLSDTKKVRIYGGSSNWEILKNKNIDIQINKISNNQIEIISGKHAKEYKIIIHDIITNEEQSMMLNVYDKLDIEIKK